MRSSAKYRPSEISHVSTDDRFAAMQIVMVTKRLLRPMSVLLSYWVLPFIVQFCGFENYIFAKMSGILDLSSDEKAKHFLPR